MNIERVELGTELLKKSSKVCFWLDKDVFKYYNLKETVNKLQKQFGLIISIFEFDYMICVIIEVGNNE